MNIQPTTWTPENDQRLVDTVARVIGETRKARWDLVAQQLGLSGYNGCRIRYQTLSRAGSAPSVVTLVKAAQPGPAPVFQPASLAPEAEQQVETKTTESGIESRAHGRHIRTVEDLLKHIQADMARYEIDRCEATKYEMGTKGEDGKPVVTELHRVWVRLKPKAGPSTLEVVEGVIAAAFRGRKPLPTGRIPRKTGTDLLHFVPVCDPHHGKHAWGRETGWGDYDLGISVALQSAAIAELLRAAQPKQPAHRIFYVGGDYFHYDNPGGTTTKGTPLERDGRVQKMIDDGAEALFDAIDASAETTPTEVIVVPGNHDQVLSWALQRILLSHYRGSKRVTIDATYTQRKYVRWGKVLLGMTHGDKARKVLPQLMARERAEDWGQTTYREIHTGHLHEAAAIQTIDGVITRTAPSLSAPDAWHAGEGFVGSLRAMEAFWYHKGGALLGMDVSSPTVTLAKRAKAA